MICWSRPVILAVLAWLWIAHGAPAAALTQTPSPTRTATPTLAGCFGDCDGDGAVTVDELLRLVNIALGNAFVDTCPAAAEDACSDLVLFITCVIEAINSALHGCPVAPLLSPVPIATPAPGQYVPPPP
jgi:hypothetical protein